MTMNAPQRALSRRAALTGLGASGLGLALSASGRHAAAQDATPTSIEASADVVYGSVDGTDLTLDINQPIGLQGTRPAVILVHGGGLIGGGRYELGSAAGALAKSGYGTFNIDYRTYSQSTMTNPWPAQLDDVQRAVRWVRANAATYNVDPERIGAFGWSSGGQLVAFMGTRETRDNSDETLAGFSSKVTCVVAMAGNFDMTIPYKYDDWGPIDAEVMTGTKGGIPSAEQIRDFSPLTFVDETSAPFLIFQEGSEDVVPYAHAERMVAALQAARVQVSYSWFPDYSHMSWGSWSSEAPETLAFFGRHLQPERGAT